MEDYLKGTVDHVSHWDRVLTPKEITELYWIGYPRWQRYVCRYFLHPTRLIRIWWAFLRVYHYFRPYRPNLERFMRRYKP